MSSLFLWYYKPYAPSLSYQQATTGEGGIERHIIDSKDKPRPHLLPYDPRESLILKPILTTTHTISIYGNQSTI